MSKTYHTDLDRDDFAPGELLPWQDMSRHLQALEHQFKILEGIIKTYFDEGPSTRIHNLEHQAKQDWDQIAALHRRIDTLEKALQTTTDSLQQALLRIDIVAEWQMKHDVKEETPYKPIDSYEGECERCGRLGPLTLNGLCKGCVLDDIMYPGRAN